MKVGKGGVFFQLLDDQANVAAEAARGLLVLVKDLPNAERHANELAEVERKGDDLTHELQTRVAGTFIPPIDPEDLNELSNVLDDITDYIEATGARIVIYRLRNPREFLIPLAEELVEITKLVVAAISQWRDRSASVERIRETLKQIHTIENASDIKFRSALQSLFDEPEADALTVMKWKEVYDRIETAIDRCEDVAKVLDNVIVKYA